MNSIIYTCNKISDHLNTFNASTTSSVVHPSSFAIAKGDSGATNHYITKNDMPALTNVVPNTSVHVSLPNSTILSSTHSGSLGLPHLSTKANTAHVLPAISHHSLISLGQLADDGCLILLNKHALYVFKNFEKILQGFRNHNDGLWDIPFRQNILPKDEKLNIIVPVKQHEKTLIQYLHAALFSPAKSTLLKAIHNNHFIGWPGLTTANVTKFLDETPATAKGHLDQHKRYLQRSESPPQQLLDDPFPPKISSKTHQVLATILDNKTHQGKAYFDLTGQFPYTSARGAKYVFVLYDYDSNAILATPINSRNASDIKSAWIKLHNKLHDSGVQPQTYIMDNEAANVLKQAMLKYKVTYQLTPPHMHRINAAERAIRTFKNHFLAGLATVDPTFPINEWDRLIEQAVITINLLRTSRLNPRLSAHAYLFGNYDFNKWPLAPPGTKVVVHTKSTKRPSWGYHGEEGFYVAPATEHYRCIQCLMKNTRRIRVTDTAQFFPSNLVPFPTYDSTDHLMRALDDILKILRNTPLQKLQVDQQTKDAIELVATILKRATPPPHHLPPLHPVTPSSSAPTLNVAIDQPPATLPRVRPRPRKHAKPPRVMKSKMHPHTRLRLRADSAPTVTSKRELLIRRLLHIYNRQTGKKETIRSLLTNPATHLTWSKASSNEYGRLMTGNQYGVIGTDTMEPIALHLIPANKAITYGSIVCDHRPLKSEPDRCRLVVGGDKLTYDHETAAPAANLLETKLMLNSTISTPGARFLTLDIKDFFLSSIMPSAEYMKLHIRDIPDDIILRYNLHALKDTKDFVHFKIKKGMYGLKQAAILAYQQLKQHLEPFGYVPIKNTVGLWKHRTRPIKFCLCVDDFGVSYQSEADIQHLIAALSEKYNLTVDKNGSNYCGLSLKWDYVRRHVDISMPGYISKLLTRLNHPRPPKPVHAPHAWHQPVYGRHQQVGTPSDTAPKLQGAAISLLQSVVGALLYYTRAVDPSMYPALNEVSVQQSAPSQATWKKCLQLLDYVSTHPNATIRYHASDMVLNVDSDAAYLVLPRAKSRLAGHFFLSSDAGPTRVVTPNGPVLTECRTIRHVVASAAEAETAALFSNAQAALPIRYMLQALGHPQPPTPLKTDNATAAAFVHQEMRHKKSKAWDMRFWWLKEKSAQSEFRIFWDKGVNNWADYFTKHFAPSVHQALRQRYVHRTSAVLSSVVRTVLRHAPARVC